MPGTARTPRYASPFEHTADQYNAEMTFHGDTVDGDEAIVRTTLILDKGGQMSLNYRMHQTRDRWQVYDLDVAGISLMANYRAQFNKISAPSRTKLW